MSDEAPRSEAIALLAELERGGALTMTSLTLTREITYDEYEGLFGMFGQLHEASAWLIGDLLNYGERIYGQTYVQAAHATGLAEGTLVNYASVCSRVPRSRRREALPFSVHAEVAFMSPAEQDRWLKTAQKNGWRRSQLREALTPVRTELGTTRRRQELEPGEIPRENLDLTDRDRTETDRDRNGGTLIVELPSGQTVEIITPAVELELPPHVCACMVCGRLHRSDIDIDVAPLEQ